MQNVIAAIRALTESGRPRRKAVIAAAAIKSEIPEREDLNAFDSHDDERRYHGEDEKESSNDHIRSKPLPAASGTPQQDIDATRDEIDPGASELSDSIGQDASLGPHNAGWAGGGEGTEANSPALLALWT